MRNTRSVTMLRLPPRFAFTTRVEPSASEQSFYGALSAMVARSVAEDQPTTRIMTLRKLMEAVGSSHVAALRMLERLKAGSGGWLGDEISSIIAAGRAIGLGSKTRRVIDLVKSIPDQKIVFINYIATLEHISEVLEQEKIRHTVFHGGMSSSQKQQSIDRFLGGCPGPAGDRYRWRRIQPSVLPRHDQLRPSLEPHGDRTTYRPDTPHRPGEGRSRV